MGALRGEREVAGLRCSAVLAGLTEYLEGGLDAETRGRVEAHVKGCDLCERFGGAFGEALAAIRRSAAEDEPAPEVLARLEARLRRAP